jgi:spore coat polysaccharide biosynthesis protein SpsF
MKSFGTDQESFWAGNFGTEYIERNRSAALLASNLHFFSNALKMAKSVRSCIEFGANIGMNLKALKLLYPGINLTGVEINKSAAAELAEEVGGENVFNESIQDYNPAKKADLVLIKGVLIHINPETLDGVYSKLAASTEKYLLVAEYYNPSPVAIPYRGHSDRLFKRDFAGEILDSHPDLKLVDYGFSYHRDPDFPQDDINWFLMEKKKGDCCNA